MFHSRMFCLLGPLFFIATVTADTSPELLGIIRGYETVADDIARHIFFEGTRYEPYLKLGQLVNRFGSRFAGSDALEESIVYLENQFLQEGFEDVHTEPVVIPRWVRGRESARAFPEGMDDFPLEMLSFGGSPGIDSLEAELVVVSSFDDFETIRDNVTGKVVLWDYYCDWGAKPIECYFESVVYRSQGALRTQEAGGVAALVRSLGPREGPSLAPHTGGGGQPNIPNVGLSTSSTDRLAFLWKIGIPITIQMSLEAHYEEPRVSQNVVAEIKGYEKPEEIVLIGGHIDSWDVGIGAMDDGGGLVIAWHALSVMKALGLRARRTIRVVSWTNEEFGLDGARAYFEAHEHEAPLTSLVMESDIGSFYPTGIEFEGSNEAREILNEVSLLLDNVNATYVGDDVHAPDVVPWMDVGVPGISIAILNDNFFHYHHTIHDNMDVQDPHAMDMCTIVWAVTSYVVADLPDLLPR